MAARTFAQTTATTISKSINNGEVAVNKSTSPSKVGIPITAHTMLANDIVVIANTVNYNGSYTIQSVTANEIVILATYVAETFGADDTAIVSKYLWSTATNWTVDDTPDDGDDVTIPAGTRCTFDNTDVYATGLASLAINGTLDAYDVAGTYVLKMAGNITGTGTLSAGTSGTAYPSNCSLTITFNGAFGCTTNLLYAVYCLEPTTKYVTLSATEAVNQTVLSISGGVDVDADAVPWANGNAICINDALGGDTELLTFESSTTSEITVSGGGGAGGGIDSANVTGAVIALVTRNITILGSGTTGIIKGWATGSYLRCSLRPAANSSSAINYGTTNTLTFDGVICPQSLTGTTGYAYGNSITGGITNAGVVIGVSRGFNSCSGFTNTGTVSANNYGFYFCYDFTNTGTVSANTYGFYYCSGFTNTGTVSANTYGFISCFCVIYSTVFSGNTYDLWRVLDCRLSNCAMGSVSENYEYTLLVPYHYTESIDHDQSAGAFKAWTKGGVVTHQINADPVTTPPIGYAVYFRHTGESATNYCFKQVPYAVEAGQVLSVVGVAKLSATLTSADDARLQIIDQFADPLADGTKSPLATASVADRTDATTWQTLACNWTNAGTLRRLVWVRTIMRHATAYVDFACKANDLPDVANVLTSDTVNWVAGTFVEADRNTDPGVANVLSSAGNYKIANVTKTPTYHAPDAAEVISTAVFGPSSGTAGTFDEAARNTDPGVAHVEDGVTYKIANVAKEGTLVGGSDPEPDPIAFLRKVKE